MVRCTNNLLPQMRYAATFHAKSMGTVNFDDFDTCLTDRNGHRIIDSLNGNNVVISKRICCDKVIILIYINYLRCMGR